MKVLLLKNVPKVGKKDEVVDVADGYATNVLFVQKSAVPATQKAIDEMKKRVANKEMYTKIHAELFEKEIEKIRGTITLSAKANEKGSLFSRIDKKNIISALKDVGISVDENSITLLKEIKELGSHTVQITDSLGKKYSLTVVVM